MSSEETLRSLDELIDGTISDEDRARLEPLLASSSELRAELARRRDLATRTASLRREIAPPTDLWPGVAAGIENRKIMRPRFGGDRVGVRDSEQTLVNWRRVGSIAAAAMLLVAVSSGIIAYLVQAPLPPEVRPLAPSEDFISIAWDGFRAAERSYQEITDELLRALDEHRSELSPETVRVVEENLRLIDEAITSARSALERDPVNAGLLNQLTDMYRKRVIFLREISRI